MSHQTYKRQRSTFDADWSTAPPFCDLTSELYLLCRINRFLQHTYRRLSMICTYVRNCKISRGRISTLNLAYAFIGLITSLNTHTYKPLVA